MQQYLDTAKKLHRRGLTTDLDYYQELFNIAITFNLDTIEEIPLHCIAYIIEILTQLEAYK